MDLSVIIVNYNVRYFLEQALLSVQKASLGHQVEVFVVDNASSDDSLAMLRKKFPAVNLIANATNPGFSVANNQAIRRAKGKYILLLNPDTVVEEDTFTKCLGFMEKHPKAGGLGVRMIDGSGKFLPESKRGFPTPWVALCKTTGLSRIFPKSPLFNGYHLGYLDEHGTHEVEVLSGAFMFLRKSVLDEIGLLDEAFFMYGEDIDLSYRIAQAGYQNFYLPATTIIHYKGESTRKGSLNYVRAFYKAMVIFARKHFHGSRANLFVGMLQTGIYLQAVMTILTNFIKKIRLPLADALAILLGMLLLERFWAQYYFQSPDYFDHPEFYFFNIPLYILLWIGSIFLNGGYDQGSGTVRRLVRGIFMGTLVLAAVYGFLPLEYRFSRALIILGAIWTLLATVSVRSLLHFFQYGNFHLGESTAKNLAIVGSREEADRVMHLLQKAGVQKNLIGLVAPDNIESEEHYIGEILVLDDLVHIFRIDEIIFCSNDVPAQSIMHWMSLLGPRVDFKILPRESLSIIGSSSKNAPGELYTIDIQFAIAAPQNRRQKRTLDLMVCLGLLPLLPFLAFFKPKLIKDWTGVLSAKKTWVGYYNPEKKFLDLPPLAPGIFSPLNGLNRLQVDEKTIQRLNFLYAKDYDPTRDFEIFWRGIREKEKEK